MNAGYGFALGAFLWWGIVPIYFRLLSHLGALEITAHRALWSAALLAVLLMVLGKARDLRDALKSRRVLLTLVGSGAMMAINWSVYVYAINSGQLLQNSLGYYLNPLINVAIGVIILRERLSRPQQLAILSAGAGVLVLVVAGGVLPWIALTLAATFGAYGLIRKLSPVDAVVGLTVELALVAPLGALLFLFEGSVHHDPWTWTLLLGTAVATAVPILLFLGATRRLPMSTMGLLQFIAPTLHLAIAVALFGEPFTAVHAITFALIWGGVGIYIWELVHSVRSAGVVAQSGED